MSLKDPTSNTGEIRAVGQEINERLAALLTRLGVKTEEVPERFRRISTVVRPIIPLTPRPRLKDQSSTT